MNILPANVQLKVTGTSTVGLAKFSLLAEWTILERNRSRQFGETIDILVEIQNIATIGVTKTAVLQGLLLFAGVFPK